VPEAIRELWRQLTELPPKLFDALAA